MDRKFGISLIILEGPHETAKAKTTMWNISIDSLLFTFAAQFPCLINLLTQFEQKETIDPQIVFQSQNLDLMGGWKCHARSNTLFRRTVTTTAPRHTIKSISFAILIINNRGTIFRFTPWPPYGFYQLARPAQGGSNRLKRITAIRAHTLLRQDDDQGGAWMALAKREQTRGRWSVESLQYLFIFSSREPTRQEHRTVSQGMIIVLVCGRGFQFILDRWLLFLSL